MRQEFGPARQRSGWQEAERRRERTVRRMTCQAHWRKPQGRNQTPKRLRAAGGTVA